MRHVKLLLNEKMKITIKVCSLLALITLLSSCATYWSAKDADAMIATGRTKEALLILKDLSSEYPHEYLLKYINTRDKAIQNLLLNSMSTPCMS